MGCRPARYGSSSCAAASRTPRTLTGSLRSRGDCASRHLVWLYNVAFREVLARERQGNATIDRDGMRQRPDTKTAGWSPAKFRPKIVKEMLEA